MFHVKHYIGDRLQKLINNYLCQIKIESYFSGLSWTRIKLKFSLMIQKRNLIIWVNYIRNKLKNQLQEIFLQNDLSSITTTTNIKLLIMAQHLQLSIHAIAQDKFYAAEITDIFTQKFIQHCSSQRCMINSKFYIYYSIRIVFLKSIQHQINLISFETNIPQFAG